MTPVQSKVLDFYRDRITRGGFVPTQVEAGTHFGVSTMRINTILRTLERKGYLRRDPGRQRGIELAGVVSLVGVPSETLRAELARRGETLDALEGSEQRKFRRGGATCAADCCQLEVKQGNLFCLVHWRQLPQKLRHDLLSAFFAARNTRSSEDASRYQELLTEARDLIDGGFYGSPFAEARG